MKVDCPGSGGASGYRGPLNVVWPGSGRASAGAGYGAVAAG
ncbi:hypothetical protein MA5S0422_2793 [Mycobacteroides abscessus 5S-0422]|uniref:Uncharacterized protein n=1 Tax=Mycobacteroides abscessus subsp. bolletii 1513 TaxID=1299321 RepID=X8DNG5_9MYCO|nr:hypothetical protein MA5S0421_2110 [Mycobacteroides abscessus 5S-0421]EIU13554.1 hypothetical protein MA5S0422_2793 [Mycobacteroides abscessus 5S-0422]EIU20580.1 hypothetical protein MA5S0708_4878 [Mycobacteroides abscessus 5S-0708]EIU23113.1 hypothetical protein MA5S0817_5173 [Mycobacteroides abscessus 5S-0817]EIU28687.1 hypothetical protein MA5S1212_4560 [Mycobacteroides abscessus 5S-1212]EIU43293.1 hypothetical protein MA5S1215_4905 [Mycobacteroides abscessus 5S-1215]EUA69949.1 hypothet